MCSAGNAGFFADIKVYGGEMPLFVCKVKSKTLLKAEAFRLEEGNFRSSTTWPNSLNGERLETERVRPPACMKLYFHQIIDKKL